MTWATVGQVARRVIAVAVIVGGTWGLIAIGYLAGYADHDLGAPLRPGRVAATLAFVVLAIYGVSWGATFGARALSAAIDEWRASRGGG